MPTPIIVVYDGNCHFCHTCIDWLALKIEITALPFQDADLQGYGVTRQECEKEVIAIAGGVIYRGAGAVAFLLDARGNRFSAWAIRSSGGLGRAGYRWVAGHRNSWVVKIATSYLKYVSCKP